MIDASILFSSKTKYGVLRVLHYHPSGLSLRQIALQANASLYSVQRALNQLVEDEIVLRKKDPPYILFELNPEYELLPLIKTFFDAEMRFNIQKSSLNFGPIAQRVIQFNMDSHLLFSQIRL